MFYIDRVVGLHMSGASFVLVGSLFGLKGALHSPPLSLLTRFVLLLSKSSHWYLFLQDLVSDFIFRSVDLVFFF